MRALVLAGGGAKGAWQAGLASVLWHRAELAHDPYTIVSGTSVGALNAAILVQDRAPERMLEVWRHLSHERVYRARGWVLGDLWRGYQTLRGRSTFYDATPLWDLIRQHLNARALEQSDRELQVHALDLDSRQQVTFRNRGSCAGDILTGVRASASLPALFQPVLWRGRELVDGGIVANVPIRSVVSAGAARVDVVTLDAGLAITSVRAEDALPVAVKPVRRGALQVASESFDAALDAQVSRDLEGVELVNQMLATSCARSEYRHVDLRIFRPSEKEDLGTVLDFDTAHLRELVARGIAAAREPAA